MNCGAGWWVRTPRTGKLAGPWLWQVAVLAAGGAAAGFCAVDAGLSAGAVAVAAVGSAMSAGMVKLCAKLGAGWQAGATG